MGDSHRNAAADSSKHQTNQQLNRRTKKPDRERMCERQEGMKQKRTTMVRTVEFRAKPAPTAPAPSSPTPKAFQQAQYGRRRQKKPANCWQCQQEPAMVGLRRCGFFHFFQK
jgi:uncharacterized protein YkwD